MAVQRFLAGLANALKSGIATEHTYRPALQKLFTTVLHPVQATNEPKHAPYGAPDFVLHHEHTPLGHVEAKAVGVNLAQIIGDSERTQPHTPEGKQLKRYRAALPNLLFTDGLVWHWFVNGAERLAPPLCLGTWDKSKKQFTVSATATPALTDLLTQFVAQPLATINTPRELAARLAQAARWLYEVISAVLLAQGETGALPQQFKAFQQTLLPTLTAEAFADMYAQTIVYGLFAARVAVPEKQAFRRLDAALAIPKTNPFLRKLFQEIAGYDLDERIAWLVDDCANLLAHTDIGAVLKDFGKVTQQTDPVVHFYETFLAAYNPALRETRGVYYTPEPVVSYMVRSVDYLLQTHFAKPMGLADDHTVLLDPATGTGTFLAAVIQHIYATISAQGLAGTWNDYVATKLLPRLFGFELLMAPYTMAHLKVGLLLQHLGYQFESNERLGIYLTNALEGAPTLQVPLPFAQYIAQEGHAANAVKHATPVMVVLGNPPYAGHSANQGQWIIDLLKGKLPDGTATASYYTVDGQPLGERNAKWLQDDYVKFMRLGQWRINQTGEGILAYICNHGYLDNPTFRGLRQSLMQEFSTIYLLNLHGNSKKKERTPDGGVDENVFAIQQGVTIGFFLKTKQPTPLWVYYAELWGLRQGKYATLSATDVATTAWQLLEPTAPWYLFVPQATETVDEYMQGWKIPTMMPNNVLGFQTHRDHFALAFDAEQLALRLSDLRDSTISDAAIRQKYALQDNKDWQVNTVRARIMDNAAWRENLISCLYRPFDWRYGYFSDTVMDRPRHELIVNVAHKQNIALLTSRQQATVGYRHCWVADAPANDCVLSTTSREANQVFPLYLYPDPKQPSLFDNQGTGSDERRPNFAQPFIAQVEQAVALRFITDGRGDLTATVGPEDIFHYTYAMLHCPTYRSRYAEFLKIDFPRLPITSDTALFTALVAKGAELVDLHLLRLPGSGGVGGNGGAALLLAPGKQGLSFPQSGSSVVEAIAYVAPQGQTPGRVMINRTQYFAGITPATWAAQLGGYQPLAKWLKDRKGRKLSTDDVLHYMRMVLALRETQRLMDELAALVPTWPLR